MKKRSRALNFVILALAFLNLVLIILGVSLVRYFSVMGFYGNSMNSLYKNFCGNVTDNYVTKALYEAKTEGFPRDWYNSLEELNLDFRIEYTSASNNSFIKYQTPNFSMDASVRSHDIDTNYFCYYSIDDYWKCMTQSPVIYYSGIPTDSVLHGELTQIYVYSDNGFKDSLSHYTVYFNILSPNEAEGTAMEESFDGIDTMVYLISFFIQYGVIIMMVFFVLFALCLFLFIKNIKVEIKDGKPVLSIWDKIPTFPFVAIFVLVVYLWISIYKYVANVQFDLFNHILLFVVLSAALAIVLLALINGLSVRIKSGTIFPWSKWFISSVSKARKAAVIITFLIMLTVTIVSVVTVNALIKHYYFKYIWMFVVAEFVVLTTVLMAYVGQIDKIFKGIRGIEDGDIEQSVSTSGMIPYLSKHAEAVNNINQVVSNAVEDKLKSEKMRTELITNVSHDIKTPLTSVINYADLISKEECNNPKIYEYCGVLSRQSIKLKKLIEDLIEASKASTGNITMHVEPMDVQVILSQALGEFDDRLSACGLEVVVNNHFSGKIKAYADSRYLWRVFDNLLTNICKYSLKNTRVYIDLNEIDLSHVSVTFKNISSTKLNMSSEELLERFARGDSSRNTEGSGLGLPIAQSLITLMGGNLQLTIDGDLFRAEVILDKYVEPTVNPVSDLPEGEVKRKEKPNKHEKKENSVRKADFSDTNDNSQ